MALATIVGAAGTMLVLVGLIGGGFEFSGSIMPKVGGVSRVLCFGVGGLLLLLSLSIAVTDEVTPTEPTAVTTPEAPSPAAPATQPPGTEPPGTEPPGTEPPGTEPPGTEPPDTEPPSTAAPSAEAPVDRPDQAPTIDPYIGFIVVPAGNTALVFEAPSLGSAVVTELADGTSVEIVCTIQGEAVTSPITGLTSSLWNATTHGGFVPDVLVDTGTDQPTMPNCLG